MTDIDSKNVYDTPSAELYDSTYTIQHFGKINTEKSRLKRNNIVSAILFVAYGVGLYFACGKIIILIANAGVVYNVPIGEVHKAFEPYKNLQVSIIPFVMVGLVAYLNVIFGKVKAGIFIILLSMIMLASALYWMNTDLSLNNYPFVIILAPLILIALNTIRVNSYRNKATKN